MIIGMSKDNKEEQIIDDQTVEFFSKLVTALTATMAIKSEGDPNKLLLPPKTTRPFDAIFAVLTQEQRNEQTREVLNEENKEEFAEVRNQFVKDLKQAIEEDNKQKK